MNTGYHFLQLLLRFLLYFSLIRVSGTRIMVVLWVVNPKLSNSKHYLQLKRKLLHCISLLQLHLLRWAAFGTERQNINQMHHLPDSKWLLLFTVLNTIAVILCLFSPQNYFPWYVCKCKHNKLYHHLPSQSHLLCCCFTLAVAYNYKEESVL